MHLLHSIYGPLCVTLALTALNPTALAGSPDLAKVNARPSDTGHACDPTELWAKLQSRHACNRLMGCKAEQALESCGDTLAPAILSRLAQPVQRLNYGSTRAVRVLGRWGYKDAKPTLESLLTESRWEMRARAAWALGELGLTSSLPQLSQALRRAREAKDRATEAACMWAQMKITHSVQPGSMLRWSLHQITAPSEQELITLNPGYYAFIAELIGQAGLTESAPTIRWGATHRDRYVRYESIQSLMILRDTAGLPYVASRLEDESPGVRRLATRVTATLAGLPPSSGTKVLLDWCKQTKCLESLNALAIPKPQPRLKR